mmetsp:Transcript_27646/g.77469  ORF Transcript_27646/g.77469 Transcript_27646/m.77469 type:complete len:225 (-) Transcript_27646:214-888(-)
MLMGLPAEAECRCCWAPALEPTLRRSGGVYSGMSGTPLRNSWISRPSSSDVSSSQRPTAFMESLLEAVVAAVILSVATEVSVGVAVTRGWWSLVMVMFAFVLLVCNAVCLAGQCVSRSSVGRKRIVAESMIVRLVLMLMLMPVAHTNGMLMSGFGRGDGRAGCCTVALYMRYMAGQRLSGAREGKIQTSGYPCVVCCGAAVAGTGRAVRWNTLLLLLLLLLLLR